MSAETQLERRLAAPPARGERVAWLRLRARLAWRFLTARFSSSLTRRIVVLNLGGLVVLVVGFLLLNQFRADIIEARIQSLTTQADIIAAAISASATGDTDSITIDPDKLLQLAPGESVAPSQSDEDAIQFSINPGAVGPVLHRLVTPTHTRARIYDSDGLLLLDSRSFSARGAVVRSDLPDASDRNGFVDRIIARSARPFPRPGSAADRRSLGDQRQDAAGGRRRAAGQNAIVGARQRRGRDHRVGRRADRSA